MRHIVIVSVFIVAGLQVDEVQACATCLAGDPTITTMGTEKPFAGRLRVSVDYLTRGEKAGEPGISEYEIDEQRTTYSASYAPSEQWIFAASLPVINKEVKRFDLSREEANGIGDADLSARWYIGNTLRVMSRHLWGLQFGIRVPTSSEETSNGIPVDIDAQPGAGATIPNLGVWYGRFQTPWFFYTSASYQHAVDTGYEDYRAGDVLLLTGHSQFALGVNLALSFSLDGRWKEKDRYSGVTDHNSGGLLVMATPGIAWTPVTDLVVNLTYQIPAIEDFNGRQEEEPNFRVGITYDI